MLIETLHKHYAGLTIKVGLTNKFIIIRTEPRVETQDKIAENFDKS